MTGLRLDSRSWSLDLDRFQIATELYHVLKCVFSLQVGHCVYGLYIIILMIIIIVVVYGYYYLSSLLAEDWHFEICLFHYAVAEKKINYCY